MQTSTSEYTVHSEESLIQL